MSREITGLPQILARKSDTHKGTYGRVSIIGGSFGMAGAVVLAGQGALRSGAGLTDCVVPERIADIVSRKVPSSLMVKFLPSGEDGTFGEEACEKVMETVSASTILAAGPGMRTTPGACMLVSRLVSEAESPLVLDADGLNCLALEGAAILDQRKGPTVLTPHPGEMSRLANISVADVQSKRTETAVSFAEAYSAVVVLKGHGTVVADGESYYINNTGNPGMAVGGSGDVLTGIIAGILASSGLSPFEAACAGVWLHGTAGDLAALKKGEVSLAPEDICSSISDAFLKYISC